MLTIAAAHTPEDPSERSTPNGNKANLNNLHHIRIAIAGRIPVKKFIWSVY